MASEEQKMLQRNALVQRLGTRLSPPAPSLQGQPQQQPGGESPVLAVSDAGEQYLIFSLLGREFAIKAEHLQGVERLTDVTPLPNVASWVIGVINLRGSISSVVDLRAFLGQESLPSNPLTRLLSVQHNDMAACLIVDGISEMLPFPETSITRGATQQASIPPWAAPYVSGSVLLEKRVILLLDAARLLFSDKIQHYSTG